MCIRDRSWPRSLLQTLAKTACPATMATEAPKPKEIPDIIVDPNSKRPYERGRFLCKPGQKPGAMEDGCEDPKAQPITWVSKVTRNILKKYFKQNLLQ